MKAVKGVFTEKHNVILLLQDLHDSLPSDPAEADLLKMAEAVADASDDADCAPSTAKKGFCSGAEKNIRLCFVMLSQFVHILDNSGKFWSVK